MSSITSDNSSPSRQPNYAEFWNFKDTIKYEQMMTTQLSEDLWLSILVRDGRFYVNLNRKNQVKWGSRIFHFSSITGITIKLVDFEKLQQLVKVVKGRKRTRKENVCK